MERSGQAHGLFSVNREVLVLAYVADRALHERLDVSLLTFPQANGLGTVRIGQHLDELQSLRQVRRLGLSDVPELRRIRNPMLSNDVHGLCPFERANGSWTVPWQGHILAAQGPGRRGRSR